MLLYKRLAEKWFQWPRNKQELKLLTKQEFRWLVEDWLFCDTQAGTNVSVIVFTVLVTTEANRLNPKDYLNHMRSVLSERLADYSHIAVDDLMPWNERIQEMFRDSDAEH